MNDMMIFSNPEFGNVRTVTIDGNPWFVGIDVAKALGYVKERNAIASHVDKEDALKCSLPSNSGVQETIVINESGLFSLMHSFICLEIQLREVTLKGMNAQQCHHFK